MQYIDESKRQIIKKSEVFDVHTLLDSVLKQLDERLKVYGVELQITQTMTGDMVLDVAKKRITRRRRSKRSLLDEV